MALMKGWLCVITGASASHGIGNSPGPMKLPLGRPDEPASFADIAFFLAMDAPALLQGEDFCVGYH